MSRKTTYNEMVQSVAQRAETTQTDADRFMRELVAVVEQTLATGDDIQLAGFGKLEPRFHKARAGRHPQTGETLQIPSHHRAAFKPFKALKDVVNAPFLHLEARPVQPKSNPLLVVRERPEHAGNPPFFIELDENEAAPDSDLIRVRPSPITERQRDTEKN
ncbi:MAG: HU family DNA-binding protein [Balneolaceae bacterium]